MNNMFESFDTDNLTPVNVSATPEQIINATQVIRYGNVIDSLNTVCPITQERFTENDEVLQILYCKHCFNKNNLLHWFERNVRCPLCRYDIRNYNSRTAIRDMSSSILDINNIRNNIHNNIRDNELEMDTESDTETLDYSDSHENNTNNNTNNTNNTNNNNNNTNDIIDELSNRLSSHISEFLSGSSDISNSLIFEYNVIAPR